MARTAESYAGRKAKSQIRKSFQKVFVRLSLYKKAGMLFAAPAFFIATGVFSSAHYLLTHEWRLFQHSAQLP